MNLLTFLKSNKNARKLFGKRELKIIEKQVLGVNLTQSEKNRLSRDIRQKLACIKELSKFSDEFELKKGSEIQELIARAKEVILEDEEYRDIKKIIVFGSTAEKARTLRSDIDIAVEFFSINLKEATKFRIRTSGSLPENIDIQVVNILPEKIKKEIKEKGRVIYEYKSKR